MKSPVRIRTAALRSPGSRLRRAPRSRQGFTLIELMVVIVILGLLVGIVGPNVNRYLVKGRIQTAKAQMSNLKSAVEAYRLEKRSLPESLEEVKDFIGDGTIPKDPWGNDYTYEKKSKKEFDIISYGGDGEPGGEDEEDQDINLASLRDDGTGKQ